MVGTAGLLASLLVQQPPAASATGRRSLQRDPRLLPLQQFWAQLVAELQQQLSGRGLGWLH